MIHKEKLEKLLVAHWAEILDIKQLLRFVKLYSETANNLTVSRFEPLKDKFLIWFEFQNSKKTFITIEAYLDLSGQLQFIKSSELNNTK
ncbi:MAG: hypothetical protein DWQ19_11085 [Crenarchaeota archaeon]|nr:MAG: hypothetical protein DWQ19_11085 [Thermoproteota archaeon]